MIPKWEINNKNNYGKIFILIIIIIIIFFLKYRNLIHSFKISQDYINSIKTKNLKNKIKGLINKIKSEENNISYKKCFKYFDISNIRIIHLIITRFLINFRSQAEFSKENIYSEDYIQNGIRVIKKYLFTSLENQSCTNFTLILMIGNQANITYINSLLNFNNSFKIEIIYTKDVKNYIRNIAKGFDVLITTRIDYDDIIYYDAVNDVRKSININRPMFLYGYNRGLIYFELDGKYCEYRAYKNEGALAIFLSLIIVLNKVNDTYTIYDLGKHYEVRKTILEKYKSFGINELNYEPAIFDIGAPKFVYVRQNKSINYYKHRQEFKKRLKLNNFNISKFMF